MTMKERSSFTIQTAFVTNTKKNASLGVRSLFCSADPNPLTLWDSNVPTGSLKILPDATIRCNVIELTADCNNNAPANYIRTPVFPFDNLSIKQPIFVMVVKNIHRLFTFEMTIVDSHRIARKLRGSTLQQELRVQDEECILPLLFTEGWNQVQIDLNDFTSRCFGTNVYFCENANKDLPHKFTKSSLLSTEMDVYPGGSGDSIHTAPLQHF